MPAVPGRPVPDPLTAPSRRPVPPDGRGRVFRRAGAAGRVPGPDPERRSYSSFTSFASVRTPPGLPLSPVRTTPSLILCRK
ncbi:hypothetical protein GCM10010496_35960 [Streptomyces asoensis]|nr:hypothetical protein GCM10010496_35960 [Streptomyces asoensis]